MLISIVYLQQGNVKKSKKLIKLVNIEEGNFHISGTTSGISIKFSGRMCLLTILKVTKNRALPLSRKYSFRKITMGGRSIEPLLEVINYIDNNWQMKKVLIFIQHLYVRKKGNSFCPSEETIKQKKHRCYFSNTTFAWINVGLSVSKEIYFICFNGSPLILMKIAFYFILKTLFVFKICKFLSWRFDNGEKTAWLER